jgi:hypothetical protein
MHVHRLRGLCQFLQVYAPEQRNANTFPQFGDLEELNDAASQSGVLHI